MGDEDEAALLSKLSLHSPREDDYAAALEQLASFNLTNGRVQEAQELFKQLQSLRASHLTKEAKVQQQQHQSHNRAEHPQGSSQGQQASSEQTGSQGEEEEDEWETKDWDQALESIRPPVPVIDPSKREQRPSFLHKPAPTAADTLAAAELVTNWSGGFDHCVELCGLTSDVRTGDLQELLDSLLPENSLVLATVVLRHHSRPYLCNCPAQSQPDDSIKPYIRWADDNHAVLVCVSVTAARNMLEIAAKEGLVMRPFLEATQASKQLPVSELLPPKDRPKTNTSVARRLMSHALGIPGMRDRAGEKDLAAARKQAREERRAKQKEGEASRASAWE